MRSSVALIAMLLAAPVAAQRVAPLPVPVVAAAGPLRLDDVLAASRDHAPQVLEALARVRAAEGRRLSAEGAFDTVFSAGGDARTSGYYDGRSVETKLVQPLGTLGGQVYGGYRVSGGRFPVYEDERYTNLFGEVKAGAVLSLLRDRLIDERRFNRTQAGVDVAVADAERLIIAIGVQRRALDAYNNWVAAGLRLAIYRGLLDLAETRQRNLTTQVARGFRAAIVLTEGEQAILRRRTLVAQAEATLAGAANTLSLYWRDRDGQPITPRPDRLPPALPSPIRLAADRASALVARPDLRTVELRLRQAQARLALDRNALRPRLDLAVEASRDLGDIGVGGRSRDGTETRVGLTFTVPLQQRAATGRLVQTTAEIDAARRRGQTLAEQIAVEIDGLAITVDASARLLDLATQETARAREMAAAERRRFAAGASDFFLVNVREEAAADADVRRLDAAARQIVAHAELAAATADTRALGLEPDTRENE